MAAAAQDAETPRRVDDDPDAALFAVIYPGLRRFAAVVGPIEEDPDDLVQEAVARALRRHGSLVALDDARAYLARTIVNLSANERRRRGVSRRRRVVLANDEAELPAYPSDLQSVLDALAPHERAVVYLVEVERRSFAEVAQLVGCTEVAARARASRARRRLRRLIEQEEEGR